LAGPGGHGFQEIRVLHALYSFASNSWSPEFEIAVVESSYGGFDVSSNGRGFAVTWLQPGASGATDAWADVFNGIAWRGATLLETGTNRVYSPRIASNGAGYAVVWSRYDGRSEIDLCARVFDGADWGSVIGLGG
jgi:hypothetical protein